MRAILEGSMALEHWLFKGRDLGLGENKFPMVKRFKRVPCNYSSALKDIHRNGCRRGIRTINVVSKSTATSVARLLACSRESPFASTGF